MKRPPAAALPDPPTAPVAVEPPDAAPAPVGTDPQTGADAVAGTEARVSAGPEAEAGTGGGSTDAAAADAVDVDTLLEILRRVVGARMGGHPDAEDVVQEALTRVLASVDRIDPATVQAYAITTARNLIASHWREGDRLARHRHRLVDLDQPEPPDSRLIAYEDRSAMSAALRHFDEESRRLLIGHEVEGRSTADLAAERDSTPGAIAAQLHRLRARLRVEYLLALEGADVQADRCRAVLLALSSHDRRAQERVDAARHLLRCELCRRLRDRLQEPADPDAVRIPIGADADIVAARQAARELASKLGFPRSQLTMIATAVSEMARNIVRFADEGEIVVDLVADTPRNGSRSGARRGVRVVARDAGPGIADLDAALRDGYSTCQGLGLGLPGAQRLADEFDIVSAPGEGTIVTMINWEPGGRT